MRGFGHQASANVLRQAAAIQEPLRSELIGLLCEHKTLTATKRYQQLTESDYETSAFVIYELAPPSALTVAWSKASWRAKKPQRKKSSDLLEH